MFDYLKAAFIGLLLGLAAIFPLAAAPVNPPPTAYAYGNGTPIAPLYGGLLGEYSMSLASGTIGAGASAASPIFSFRYGGSGVAIVKRVTITVYTRDTAFTAGDGIFRLFAARAFTASDSGGTAATLTTNNGKLRTSFATTAVSDVRISSTAALTAGTRTLDATALATVQVPVAGTVTYTTLLAPTDLWVKPTAGDYPAVFATNEGFIIAATVPATGTWSASVSVDWAEYSSF